MIENNYPALYQAADTASKTAQKHFFLALGGNLLCLVVGTVLSNIVYPSALFATVQAVILLIGLGLAIFLAYQQPQRTWYSTRALAESVKTITWRYMMRAEPFNISDKEAKLHFTNSMKKILASNKRACGHAVEFANQGQITEQMDEYRSSNISKRKMIYIAQRIDDQFNWYKNKALSKRKQSRNWFLALIALNGLAVLFAVGRVAVPSTDYWPTDALISAAGALMAWLQTARYQELAASYALTAHEISLIKATMPVSRNVNSFSTFVADAENAFSREHTQWQARRDVD